MEFFYRIVCYSKQRTNTTTTKEQRHDDFGTYKNQYGKTVHDRGPSDGMIDLIITLLNEKVVPNGYVADLVDRFNTDDLSGREAKSLIDALIAGKSKIVAPSTLPKDGERKPASEKQLYWIDKMLGEKDVPADEASLIGGWVIEGFPGRNAGRVMDYLFGLPNANAVTDPGLPGRDRRQDHRRGHPHHVPPAPGRQVRADQPDRHHHRGRQGRQDLLQRQGLLGIGRRVSGHRDRDRQGSRHLQGCRGHRDQPTLRRLTGSRKEPPP